MLYDLNVPWSPTLPHAELERTIAFLSSLGYNTIALNHDITSLPSHISNPIPPQVQQPFAVPATTTLLRRCTLAISDPSLNHRLPQLAAHYDLVALRPTTEKAFLAACPSLTEHSIISLNLAQRYDFHFKQKPLMTAVNRGVRIEICYAQATGGDTAARRNVIGNAMAIVRATKGRGLLVSSGGAGGGTAGGVLGIRAPADVVNLLGVWGLGRERGVEGMGVNARAVVVNEGLKRNSFRGVIEFIEGDERAEKGERSEKSEKQGNNNAAAKKDKGKRRADESTGSSLAEGTPQMSKRQAKRMRIEALKKTQTTASTSGSPGSASSLHGSSTPEATNVNTSTRETSSLAQ